MLSIIIVNYNTVALTADCIRSIYRHVSGTAFEIIVVDNASPTEPPDTLGEMFPDIKLIKSLINGGFAKGNNLGISHAAGNIILLLNSDTYLESDCLTAPTNYLRTHPHTGALSIHITYPDGRFQHTARRFRSIGRELLDLGRPFLKMLPYKKRSRFMLNQYFGGDYDTPADWVSGAFMMFRKETLQHLPDGKLDERFFMYGEDQLWCYQFQQAGLQNYFLSAPRVVHIANASTEPAKRARLLKTMTDHELDIIAYRKGKGLYYLVFKGIFLLKEYGRFYMKQAALKYFNRQIH